MRFRIILSDKEVVRALFHSSFSMIPECLPSKEKWYVQQTIAC